MTDALADWFLRELEAGRAPCREMLLYAQSENDDLISAAFAEWIEMQRESRLLRNDDVTMMVVGF
jgi:hypothetical protein